MKVTRFPFHSVPPMIEAVIITTPSGDILYSRYYTLTDLEEIDELEQQLYKVSSSSWNNAKKHHEVAVLGFDRLLNRNW